MNPIPDGNLQVEAVARGQSELQRTYGITSRATDILQTVVDHVPVMLNFVAPSGRIEWVNREWERVLGWSLEEARQDSFLRLTYPDQADFEHVQQFIARSTGEWAHFRTRVRDGRFIHTRWANIRLPDGTSIGIGEDWTRREAAEAKAKEAEERYRSEQRRTIEELRAGRRDRAVLTRRLLEIQEDERTRLARELHDEMGQALTVLKLELQTIGRAASLDHVEQRVAGAVATVDGLIDATRRISWNLRPALLDQVGLAAALRSLARDQATVAGLALRLDIKELDERLPREIETVCFRIAQGAITNVVRHAQARELSVELRIGDRLTLLVGDDGIGLGSAGDPATRQTRLGLLGMRERAQLVGGTCEIHSGPAGEGGTLVRVSLPVRVEAEGTSP